MPDTRTRRGPRCEEAESCSEPGSPGWAFWVLFPADSLIVDLTGDLEPDEEVVATCQEMKEAGYSLAIDCLTPLEEG